MLRKLANRQAAVSLYATTPPLNVAQFKANGNQLVSGLAVPCIVSLPTLCSY